MTVSFINDVADVHRTKWAGESDHLLNLRDQLSLVCGNRQNVIVEVRSIPLDRVNPQVAIFFHSVVTRMKWRALSKPLRSSFHPVIDVRLD